MWRIFISIFFILYLLQAPATADMHGAAAEPESDRLNELFSALKEEHNTVAARRIADRIQQEWKRSGGATADMLIDWAREAAVQDKHHVALDFLDQVVTLYPEYVEGWNSRALVHLMMNDFNRAMADLSRTLALEPRHFGAMNGVAGILRATGREELALGVYRRMLEVYPMQRGAQRALIRLTEDSLGQRL
ncbi:hypothetical protein [Chelativorans sp. YIM 93263]|uniref:hypothetical protein n=1 Tax=Chelativorans sp. YIM 93263 TaxID=2906648 RepID=UPI0023786ED1|nr:hypothetical protein [Chelativorans sp. YIM 93263]